MKTYKVWEVREYTGLTRKQLYTYEKGIPPVDRENEAGYKLYDEEGLDKLILASYCAKFGIKPQQINEIFGAEDYDRSEVIDFLITCTYAEADRMADILTILQALKKIDKDTKLSYNPLQYKTLRMLAESIRSEEEREKYRRDKEKKL